MHVIMRILHVLKVPKKKFIMLFCFVNLWLCMCSSQIGTTDAGTTTTTHTTATNTNSTAGTTWGSSTTQEPMSKPLFLSFPLYVQWHTFCYIVLPFAIPPVQLINLSSIPPFIFFLRSSFSSSLHYYMHAIVSLSPRQSVSQSDVVKLLSII